MSAHLSLDDIAEHSGEDPSFVARCQAAGLLESSAENGYRLRDAGRVRLVRLLLRRGIDFEAIVRAEDRQGVLAHFVDDLFPEGSWPSIPLEEAARRVDLDIGIVERMWEAAGFGDAGSSFTEEDLATLQGLALALTSGFPEEALLQMVRVYADALGRVAEAESRLFHFYVHERLRADGLSGRQLMDSTHAVGEELRALMEPAILYFHGKSLAKSLEQDFVLHAAEESGLLPPSDITGRLHAAVVFVDLASFTSLTESMGDLTATEVLSRFSQLVRRAVNHCEGRVVKQIGDAFMLVFDEATSALGGALEIQQRAQDEPQFLGTRLGVHCGPVLYREGDYFGATVNVAARITAEASRNQIVVTDAVRSSCPPPPETEFVSLGTFRLRGLSEAVELFELQSGRRPAVERSTDPVCGMQLAPNEVVGRVAVDDGERVFCSLECLGHFSEHPERYAS